MSELPDYMYQRERHPDQDFQPEEFLYRRVPKDTWDEGEMWEDDDIDLDCIEFPDMSVNRGKYGGPESVRWERGSLHDWGVIGFRVKHIPERMPFQGAFIYSMRPVHRPLKRNYPHSEVQVFERSWEGTEGERHIGKQEMPGVTLEAQLEWRELLRRRCQIVLRPGEVATPPAQL